MSVTRVRRRRQSPPGIYQATWREIRERFGWNEQRVRLLQGIELVALELRAARCRAVWLDGSFVTTKEEPADYDLASTEISRLDPSLRTLRDRTAMKERYGGDSLPTDAGMPFVKFFQTDRDGRPKGIVQIDLESLT